MIRLLLILMVFVLAFTGNGQNKNFIDMPYIEVNGKADTLVTPDIILIKIIISEKDTKSKESLDEIEKKLVLTLQSLGIDIEKNLKISDILSNFRYYLLKKKDIVLTKEYLLRVNSAELASKVFIKLEELDISNATIYQLDHTLLENIKNICRTKAVLHAQKTAIALTQPLGQSIGNAIHIADFDPIPFDGLGGRVTGINVQNYRARENVKLKDPVIEFEKINVTSNVKVTFMLK